MPINTTHSRCISPSRARSCRLAAQPIGVRYLMGFFQRRRRELVAAEPCPTSRPERGQEEPRRTLLRVTSEALILQDDADAVLAGVRGRQHMGILAPRAGPLVRRFFALRDLLPPRYDDPDAERWRALLDSILHHHALLLSMALDLLAYEWRSERIAEQVDALDGMGAPGRWLEELYAQLRVALPSSGPVTVGG